MTSSRTETEIDKENNVKFLTGVVTRQSIDKMSTNQQNRFMDAVLTMCKNKNGPGTSDFFRIAGYHGAPEPVYCSHGRETFPGWHRIFLKHFEDHLRLADQENGNDGNIGLPYWDWSTNQEIPKIVRDRFSEFPKDLFPTNFASRIGRLRRSSNSRIRRNIRNFGVVSEANDCLLIPQHWVHASTGNEWASRHPSIESPHNSIHGIVGGSGGQMGSVAFAAFDILFWLHHCNIDRIYEKYVELEPDSNDEFEAYQDRQRVDLYDLHFTPFDTLYPKKYLPKDTFHVQSLGYKYDQLPPTPKQELRLQPTVVVYPQIKVHEFESKCYQVHCFLVDKTKLKEFKPPKKEEDFDDNPNYAGSRMIFGRGMECQNCQTRDPYDIVIDVSECLRNLNISRYNVKVLTYVFETNTTDDVYLPHNETALPDPYISGPTFENVQSNLTETNDNDDEKSSDEVSKSETTQLQKFLKRYGYYDGKIDGLFKKKTLQAVKDYQKALGLKVDGIVGPITKKNVSTQKRCNNIDGFAENNVKDKESRGEKNYKKKELTYNLLHVPGYLKRNEVLKIIELCFNEWSKACGLKFKYIDNKKTNVDIKIDFNEVSKKEDNQILRFDGIGGVLGHSGKGYIYFDLAERWVLGYDLKNNKIDNNNISNLNDVNTWYRSQPKISFYYTCLHEIGHTLGLDHSNDGKDVMGPYYSPQLIKLQKNDVQRIKKLYT